MVKLLLETGGVDPDSKDSKGWTPLLHATRYEAVVKLLLATENIDPESQGQKWADAAIVGRCERI